MFYHKVGDEQSKDELIYKDKDHALRNYSAATTEDEKLLLLYGSESTSGTSLAVKDLSKPKSDFITLVDNFENNYSVIDNDGNKLLVVTDKGAPKYQLLEIDFTQKLVSRRLGC